LILANARGRRKIEKIESLLQFVADPIAQVSVLGHLCKKIFKVLPLQNFRLLLLTPSAFLLVILLCLFR